MFELSTIGYIFIFTFLGSIMSLIGGVFLLLRKKAAYRTSHLLASFAAGTLLGAAFFELLPEAIHGAEVYGIGETIFIWTLFGMLLFFLLERFIHWFHHHHVHGDAVKEPAVPLIIFGDSIHNFIDGITIAITFLTSIPLGIATSLAVIAHEIPQEIGDFGILLHKGMSKKNALLVNIISASVALVGAAVGIIIGEQIKSLLPIFLALTAGFFIYIAASDLIPEIHEENRKGFALIETILLVCGAVVTYILISYFHE